MVVETRTTNEYVTLYDSKKTYHLLVEPVDTWETKSKQWQLRTKCGLRLDPSDKLFPRVPLNRRLCKHCEKVRAKQNEL